MGLDAISESPPSSPAVSPAYSDGGTNLDEGAYTPFTANVAATMREAAAECAYDACISASLESSSKDEQLIPVSDWVDVAPPGNVGKRLPGGHRALLVEVAISDDERPSASLLAAIGYAMRADSPDAPSTHAEAMQLGEIWMKAEQKELDNHSRNESWLTVSRDQVPAGRRIHKLIWVYKTKRDGTKMEMDMVMFKSFDTNGDGYVSMEELDKGLKPKTRRKIEMILEGGWKFDEEAVQVLF